jgi:hypothetical protein
MLLLTVPDIILELNAPEFELTETEDFWRFRVGPWADETELVRPMLRVALCFAAEPIWLVDIVDLWMVVPFAW